MARVKKPKGPIEADVHRSNLANLHMLREALGSSIMIARRADVMAQNLTIDIALVEHHAVAAAAKHAYERVQKALKELRMADTFVKEILDVVSERSARKR